MPRQAASVIVLRGGRRGPRGAARPAHAEGPLHGRRVGLPRRRGRRRTRARATRAHRAAGVRELARGGLDRASPAPTSWSPFSRWITPREVSIRFDTHFFLAELPAGQQAAGRRRGVRRPALDDAARGRSRRARPASCRWSSRRSSTCSSSQPFELGRRAARRTRAGARCCRSSRAWSWKARSRGSSCPASPATTSRVSGRGRESEPLLDDYSRQALSYDRDAAGRRLR